MAATVITSVASTMCNRRWPYLRDTCGYSSKQALITPTPVPVPVYPAYALSPRLVLVSLVRSDGIHSEPANFQMHGRAVSVT